ncbi:MAG: hypothetical protein EP344_02320 [Bacteroidetes bacterium]|nr:MAG: hypothetical protein EP344_02320 [Bacteroidota bacterium]
MNANIALAEIVQQIKRVIVQMPPESYQKPLTEFDGNTLGQHFRHILEFYQCLEASVNSGIVDYAARERNPVFETNPVIAAAAFEAIAHRLPKFDLNLPVQVRAEFGSDDRPCYDSTLGRELLFVYDHAIHHLAIIKIGLSCQFPEIQVEKDLGVSPSTIKSRSKIDN